jgi:hypothetical protein
MGRLAAGIDPSPAGDGLSLASDRFQAVLEVAFSTSDTGGKKMYKRGIGRAHLPHGRRESDVEYAADSW